MFNETLNGRWLDKKKFFDEVLFETVGIKKMESEMNLS